MLWAFKIFSIHRRRKRCPKGSVHPLQFRVQRDSFATMATDRSRERGRLSRAYIDIDGYESCRNNGDSK